MDELRKQRSVLIILLAACRTALDAFYAADNPLDEAFIVDLERIVTRTEAQLAAFDEPSR